MYTFDEAFKASLEYFSGEELPANVFVTKYALQDNDGNYLELTPDDMHHRTAREFARIEKKKFKEPLSHDDIYLLLKQFKYIIPQGSPMYGIGNNYTIQSLGNCFTIGEHPLDSYGGILYADQMLVQLSKRRCVGSETKIIHKIKGCISIEEVRIGDEILSFNLDTKQSEFKKVLNKFETIVPINNRIQIQTNNGSIIRTSKKHEILSFGNNEYNYTKDCNFEDNDCLIHPEYNDKFLNYDKSLNDIGWWIGYHIGDGACNVNNNKARFRVLDDNLDVVKKYAEITNKLCNSNCKVSNKSPKRYKTQVYTFCHKSKKALEILNIYLDNQHGSKTYTANIPKFVIDNNIWLPFLAGLIDSDGWVRKEKTIRISICAKNIIKNLSEYLSSIGIRYCYNETQPKRENESKLYNLIIYASNNFIELIVPLLKHPKKIKRLLSKNREYSRQFLLSNNEIADILYLYNNQKYQTNRYNKATKLQCDNKNNLSSIISILKRKNKIGLGGLNSFFKNNLITKSKYNEILQRDGIKFITQDLFTNKYYDLEVEHNNNFYAGDNGFIVIHNCGVGLCLDNIRPKGMPTKNAAKTTDGISVFMERFSNSIREVAQNGRRGASLQGISIHHPEVETFINIKQDTNKVTGSNVSVLITDEFMIALEADGEYEQRWPVNSKTPIIKKLVKAKYIWDQIINAAWKSAEPGICYIDKIRNYGLSHQYHIKDKRFADIITNPCGELPIGLDSCRLLLINLYSYVTNPFADNSAFNHELFNKHCQIAQRLMDDMVDLEIEKIQKIIDKVKQDPEPDNIKQVELDMWENYKETAILGRRTGLGITGLGDCLAALNIRYGSEESIKTTEEIYKQLCINSMISSCKMAEELGAFPLYDKELENNHPFLVNLFNASSEVKELHDKFGRRNISLTTTAPAGTVSILSQTTSGIEPVFMVEYTRRKKLTADAMQYDFIDNIGDKWQEYKIYHKHFKTWRHITGKSNIEESPYYKATSNDIDWKTSVILQASAQKWITHSISKTCNLPNSATKELIDEVYRSAYKAGCKGFTVYRDGCRSGVLVNSRLQKTTAPKRPRQLPCKIYHVSVVGSKFLVLVGLMDGDPYEVMAYQCENCDNLVGDGVLFKKKRGHYQVFKGDELALDSVTKNCSAEQETVTRLISSALRHGTDIGFIVHQLEKTTGDMCSFTKAIARVLKKHIKDNFKVTGEKCGNCDSENLKREEGCLICVDCGNGKCG